MGVPTICCHLGKFRGLSRGVAALPRAFRCKIGGRCCQGDRMRSRGAGQVWTTTHPAQFASRHSQRALLTLCVYLMTHYDLRIPGSTCNHVAAISAAAVSIRVTIGRDHPVRIRATNCVSRRSYPQNRSHAFMDCARLWCWRLSTRRRNWRAWRIRIPAPSTGLHVPRRGRI